MRYSKEYMIILQDAEPLPRCRARHHVRLVVLSDTHGNDLPPSLPEGDILLHLGDVANRGNLSDIRSFVRWAKASKFPEIVVLEGNHDRDLDQPNRIRMEHEYNGLVYLKDEYRELAGGRLKVFGASWDSCERDEYHRLALAKRAPVDILLTHAHPHLRRADGPGWKGSREITNLVHSLDIPLHLFGHVHRGQGAKRLENESIMVNCCTTRSNLPVVIDWDPEARKVVMVHCPMYHPLEATTSHDSDVEMAYDTA